ncbi:MAG TPA: ABC transporter permease, partial [Bacillales bacterium]|nr:ABC transporter permease [Bacillales bacterium]
MNKFWTVLFHTYSKKLRTKSYVITTVIAALLLLGVTNFSQIKALFDGDQTPKVGVIDKSGKLYRPLAEQINQGNMDLEKLNGGEAKARQKLKQGKIEGYLLLSSRDGLPAGVYKAKKIVEQKVPGQLQQALQQLKITMATKKLGLDSEALASVYSPVSFQKVALAKGAKTEKELDMTRNVVYVLLFFLYFSVIFYGSMIAMEVATEKSSRVMEILISSVSPVKQMFGKILGVVLLGLTQYAFLFAVMYISAIYKGSSGGITKMLKFLNMDGLPVGVIVYAVIFFLLGYFLYATLFAMLGSLVDRVEEANQMMTPVVMT